MDSYPLDTLSYEAALDRLLSAAVVTNEQLYDYGLNQSLRGLFVAVKSRSQRYVVTPQSRADGSSLGGSRGVGGDVVLHRIAVAALQPSALPSLYFLSTRLLCDTASNFGEGCARPCCKEEWTDALLAWGKKTGKQHGVTTSVPLQDLLDISRSTLLGYMTVLSGTIRMIARGAVEGQHLFTHHSRFVATLVASTVPQAARTAEGLEDERVQGHTSAATVFRPPSRLTVEANNFVIHTAYWLASEVLVIYQGTLRDESPSQKKAAHPVLDRDLPQKLWSTLSLTRNALRRALGWIDSETQHHAPNLARDGHALSRGPGCHVQEITPESNLACQASAQVEVAVTRLLKHQERIELATRNVLREYGDHAKDYHALCDLLWRNTLRMCLFLQTVLGSWVSVQGGLGAAHAADGIVLRTDRDVVAYIASCLLRVPALEGSESEPDVVTAQDALLGALVALAAASPLREMQNDLWTLEPNITRQIHTVLVHRALRYRDEQVLRLATLLIGTIVNTTSPSASRAVTETSDQLLEMLSDDRDAASQCAVELLTGAILQRPHVLIPSLFRLLEHGTTVARRNVLEVLTGLPHLGTVKSSTTMVSEKRFREVMAVLSEHLLLQLHDEELVLRMQATSLFAKVWPMDVITPLLNISLQRDDTGKKQSVSKAALNAVVTAHVEDADIMLLLWQESFLILQKQQPEMAPRVAAKDSSSDTFGEQVISSRAHHPSTPGDILAYSMLYNSDAIDTDRAEGSQPPPLDDNRKENAKTERLTAIVCALIEVWITHLAVCDGAQHVLPLLVYGCGVSNHLAQQWTTKMLTCFLRCYARRFGDVAIKSLQEAFLPAEAAVTTEHGSWLAGLSRYVTLPQSERERAVFPLLLPLLCLRSCGRDCLGKSPMTTATSMWWTALWACVTDHMASPESFLRVYPDAQRLLVEVLTIFPCGIFFDCVTKALRGAADPVFFGRVAVFGFGSYLAAASYSSVSTAEETAGGDGGSPPHMASEVLRHLPLLHQILTDTFLPWLRSPDVPDEAGAMAELEMKKLSISCVDTLALATLVALESNTAEALDGCEAHTRAPLLLLARFYREKNAHADGAGATTSHLTAEVVRRPAEEEHCLASFQLSVQVLRGTLVILRAHPRTRTLFSMWVSRYLHPLVEVANAACASPSINQGETAFRVAATAAEVVFEVMMLASKAAPALVKPVQTSSVSLSVTLNPSTQGLSDCDGPSRSLLMKLPLMDRQALLQFALGCTRYHPAPNVQRIGVQMLSALLGASPEIFAESPSAGGLDSFQVALQVLGNIALMHSDAATRALAENVLQILSAES